LREGEVTSRPLIDHTLEPDTAKVTPLALDDLQINPGTAG